MTKEERFSLFFLSSRGALFSEVPTYQGRRRKKKEKGPQNVSRGRPLPETAKRKIGKRRRKSKFWAWLLLCVLSVLWFLGRAECKRVLCVLPKGPSITPRRKKEKEILLPPSLIKRQGMGPAPSIFFPGNETRTFSRGFLGAPRSGEGRGRKRTSPPDEISGFSQPPAPQRKALHFFSAASGEKKAKERNWANVPNHTLREFGPLFQVKKKEGGASRQRVQRIYY